jgi:hypothetical protein
VADDSAPPSFLQGLMSGLSGTNPLVNAGLGLMSAAKPYGNVGDALMNANQQTIANQGARQAQGIQSYQLARQKEMWPIYQSMLQNRFGTGNMTNPAPATGGVPSPAPANRYAPLPPLPPMGNPANDLQMNTLSKAMGMPALAPDPKDTETALATQQKQRQQAVAPQLADLDTIMTSADADKRLAKDSDLRALWDQEQAGQPLTPPAARAYAGTVYNRLAGSAQAAVKPIPTMLQTTQRGLGESIQTDPVSGKITSGASALPTSKFVQNGQVVELPTAQGVAQKLQPYDSALYAGGLITSDVKEQAYQTSKATGEPTAALAGRDPIAAAELSAYIAQRAKEEGVTGLAMAAQKQAYKSQQGVLEDYTSGASADKIGSINTAVLHLKALGPLIDAMQNPNLTKLAAARQAYQKATGVAAPTNYDALANMATGEVNSAINKNGGDMGERERIAAPFASERSGPVLKEAVNTAATALAGKTESLGNRWDIGTQGTQGNFGKFVMPETAKSLGWTLHQDAKGRKAYVSPDGKYFRQL